MYALTGSESSWSLANVQTYLVTIADPPFVLLFAVWSSFFVMFDFFQLNMPCRVIVSVSVWVSVRLQIWSINV